MNATSIPTLPTLATVLLACGDDGSRAFVLDPAIGQVEVLFSESDSDPGHVTTLHDIWSDNDGTPEAEPLGFDFYAQVARLSPDVVGVLHLGAGGAFYLRVVG